MTGDQASTCGEPRAERLRTSVDGLELRALHELDAFAYHALVRRNAEHLTRFGDYTDDVAATAQQHRRELAERDSVPLRFGILLGGELIGRADLVAVAPPAYGLGFWLGADAIGRGLATAAVSALLGHARVTLGATDIYAGVTHGNDKSAALLERVGFRFAQRFEDYTRYHLHLGVGA